MIKLRAIAECTIQLEKSRLDASSEILFGILAHLIAERGKPVPRARLVDAFWWNVDEADGRHCLRQTVYKLRQLGAPIESGIDTFTLGDRVALADFDCADERTLALSPLPPEEAVSIFPGYAPRASAPFLTWLERTRERAARAVRGVLVRALGEARRRNGWDEAAKLARQCLVLDPLNEEATLTLAEYTALQGDKREALRLIDSYMEEIGGTYADLRIPAALLRNRISERVAYPPASAAGKIAIVGRDDSLRVLASVSAEVNGGAGQTCVVHGPPGIGKTRLLTEFANIAALKGARLVRVDCHAGAADRALSVFMELAPQLLRMPGALGCSPEALRLVRRLGQHDPNERLDPREHGGAAFLHAAVRASLRDLIDAIAAERPLYMLIEDVHWIDPISLEVLKEIIGSNRSRQLLVVMTTRTLGDGSLLADVDRRQLIVHELAPLGDSAARRLAETLCRALAIHTDAELIEWCIQRGAGNPLFMTELLAHWRETKDTKRVPVSLEALIDERVGALSEAALRTLQAVALLEGEATYEILEAVLGMQRWQVIGCVEELDKGGLVTGGADKLSARHHLIGTRAYSRLSTSARVAFHSRIATTLRSQWQRAGDARALWAAVTHYAQAGERAEAITLSIEGAKHLAALGAHLAGARLLHAALPIAAAPQEKLLLLDERLPMLLAASAFDDVSQNSQLALEIERAVTGSTEIHNAHELAVHVIHHQPSTLRDVDDGAFEALLACASALDAAPSHRLSAACYGLATTSLEAQERWAARFYGAATSVSADNSELRFHQARCELIYHTIFGCRAAATAIANEIQALCCQLDRAQQMVAARICGYTAHLAGDLLTARRLFDHSYAIGMEAKRFADAATALVNRAATFVDERDYDAAWAHYSQAAALLTNDSARPPGPLISTGAELAFGRGHLSTALDLVARVPPMRPLRYRLDVECLQIYRQIALRKQVDLSSVSAALDKFQALARFGMMDFNAGVLSLAVSQHDLEQARSVVEGYLALRRERGPIGNAILLRAMVAT